MKRQCIEYKTFSEEYYYGFDEDEWLNKLGQEGWILISKEFIKGFSSSDRTICGKFWRPK